MAQKYRQLFPLADSQCEVQHLVLLHVYIKITSVILTGIDLHAEKIETEREEEREKERERERERKMERERE